MRLLILALLAVTLTGCSAIKADQQPALNLRGNWQLTLSESQATVVAVVYGNNNYPPTVIDLAIHQSGTALSAIKIMIANAGCNQAGSGAWWEIAGWNQSDLTNVSGTTEGQIFTLRMNESNEGTGAQGAQLVFTGAVSQDGKTLNGMLSDGCTGAQTVPWSAVQVNSFPE